MSGEGILPLRLAGVSPAAHPSPNSAERQAASSAQGRAVVALLILLLTGNAFAAERNSVPQGFETGYQPPAIGQPSPRSSTMEVLDVVLLAGFLALGSYLALKFRKRWAILLLMLAAMGYFGFYRKGCICPIGAVQNVALAAFDSSYTIPLAAVAFFVLPLLATLIWGRTFCGSVCPFGALQDVVMVKPVRIPGWLDHALGLLPFVYLSAGVLLAATGCSFLICKYDPFVAFFRRQGSMQMLLIGALLLVIGLFLARPYCRFLCPYGAILGLLARLSWRRPVITRQKCIQCRLCEDACPFDAILMPTPALPPRRRLAGKAVLAALILLLPAILALAAWGGMLAAQAIAWQHPLVPLARMVQLEDDGKIQVQPDELKAFRLTGQTSQELFDRAAAVQDRFVTGGALAGGFLGLIIAAKLIGLTVRRRREDYQIDPAKCVSCGLCFNACPLERQRKGSSGPSGDRGSNP